MIVVVSWGKDFSCANTQLCSKDFLTLWNPSQYFSFSFWQVLCCRFQCCKEGLACKSSRNPHLLGVCEDVCAPWKQGLDCNFAFLKQRWKDRVWMLFPTAPSMSRMLLSAQPTKQLPWNTVAHTMGRNSRVCVCHWSAQELQSNLTESWNSEGWKGPLRNCMATSLLSVIFQCQQMLSLGDVHNEKCKKKVWEINIQNLAVLFNSKSIYSSASDWNLSGKGKRIDLWCL